MFHRHTRSFDRWAPRYDRSIMQWLVFGPVHEAVLEAYGARAGPPVEVLDVGCGTGRLLERAADRWDGARLTGVDVSGAMLAEARRKHEGDERFRFIEASASALPLEAGSFDAAFSTISFHHWDDQQAGVGEVVRVLRPGGLFVLADMSPPLLFLSGPLLRWLDGSQMRSAREIDRIFERAGLAVLAHRRIGRISRTQMAVGRKG